MMNAADLRAHVAQYLNGLSQPAVIEEVVIDPLTPVGSPLDMEVTLRDPVSEDRRTVRITFEDVR